VFYPSLYELYQKRKESVMRPIVEDAFLPFSAALLIDMQSKFVGLWKSVDLGKLVGNQAKVIRYCAALDIPLVVLEYKNRGATLAALQKEIRRVPRVLELLKCDDNGFSNPRLHKMLQQFGAKTLLLMGINASHCVRRTALGAVRRHYSVLTAENLIVDSPNLIQRCYTARWCKKNGVLLLEKYSV